MSDDGQQAGDVISTDFYGLFAGAIDQLAVQRFHNVLSIASQNGIGTAHLLFQSSGGLVGDGISLYNLFRASPIDIVFYNVGSICSIGVIAYLGARKRKVSKHGAFMIHRSYLNPVGANADRITAAAEQLAMEDARTEAILRENTNLGPAKWEQHRYADVWLSAQESVDCGLAEFGEFSPPSGTKLFNVWPPQN